MCPSDAPKQGQPQGLPLHMHYGRSERLEMRMMDGDPGLWDHFLIFLCFFLCVFV